MRSAGSSSGRANLRAIETFGPPSSVFGANNTTRRVRRSTPSVGSRGWFPGAAAGIGILAIMRCPPRSCLERVPAGAPRAAALHRGQSPTGRGEHQADLPTGSGGARLQGRAWLAGTASVPRRRLVRGQAGGTQRATLAGQILAFRTAHRSTFSPSSSGSRPAARHAAPAPRRRANAPDPHRRGRCVLTAFLRAPRRGCATECHTVPGCGRGDCTLCCTLTHREAADRVQTAVSRANSRGKDGGR